MKRMTFLLVLVLGLAACSSLPVFTTVDLKARLGAEAEGSFETHIEKGDAGSVDIRFPDEGDAGGELIDFSDEDIGVTLEKATLHYNIDLRYDGPELSGKLQAQLYVAPANGDELWQGRYKLGPTVTLNLDKDTEQLVGQAVLNKDQLEAVNEQKLRYGVLITGRDVGAAESGTATIYYEVNDLRLRIGVSVIPISTDE